MMDGSGARSRSAGNDESRQDNRDWQKVLHIVEQALRNSLFTYEFTFGTDVFADPCVLGEPLVRDAADWTAGSAKKYRGGSEGSWFNTSARRDWLPGLRATDHNHAHEGRSSDD